MMARVPANDATRVRGLWKTLLIRRRAPIGLTTYGALSSGRRSGALALLAKVPGGAAETARKKSDEVLARLTRRAPGFPGGTVSPRTFGYAAALVGVLLGGAAGFLIGRRLVPDRGRITSGDTGQRAAPPAGPDGQSSLPSAAEVPFPTSGEGEEETPVPFTEEVPVGPEEVQMRLQARLERDPRTRNLRYPEVQIVEVGVAEVRGFARSAEQKSAVEEVIRGAEGVSEVRNHVEIRRVL